MKIVVSPCLLGRCCKYNGGHNFSPAVERFLAGHQVLALCPEELSGLGTPRTPVELLNGRAVDQKGNDVDLFFRQGVARAMEQAAAWGPDMAVLKSRSPTCGTKEIYDGSFTHTLIPGMGLFAKALYDLGIELVDSDDIDKDG